MSSKVASYYDWTLNFKKNAPNHNLIANKPKINSIGIKDNEFKDFLKKWKKQNL